MTLERGLGFVLMQRRSFTHFNLIFCFLRSFWKCTLRWHRRRFALKFWLILENVILKLCVWNCASPARKWLSLLPSGCSKSSTKTCPSLFHRDTCCRPDPEVGYASFEAQRLLVFSSMDVVYILGLPPYPRWNPSWFMDMPIWKNLSFAILALCDRYIVATSSLFIPHVFSRDQTSDVFKKWNSDWCLRLSQGLLKRSRDSDDEKKRVANIKVNIRNTAGCFCYLFFDPLAQEACTISLKIIFVITISFFF